MNFNIQKTFLRFTTVLISTAGLALVLSFFLFFKNINRVVSVWGEIEKVTVYVDSEASKGEVEKLKNQIQALSEVKEVNFISKEEAIDDFKAQMAGYIQDFKKDVNLMQVVPSYFEVSVELDSSFESTVKKLNLLSQKIGRLDFVEEVSYGSIWIDKYSKLIDYISSLAGFIGIILITSTFLVISNLIKSNLYQRSKEIEVLEMIGATKSYIRKPFLKEGAVMSFLGGCTSILIVWALYYFFNHRFNTQMKFFKLDNMFVFLGLHEIIIFLIFSTAIGYFSSYLNLIRFKWNQTR